MLWQIKIMICRDVQISGRKVFNAWSNAKEVTFHVFISADIICVNTHGPTQTKVTFHVFISADVICVNTHGPMQTKLHFMCNFSKNIMC